MPSRIASEKWSKRKRKQSGVGYFQKNKKVKVTPRDLEDWEKIPIIPWGGDYTLPNGEIIRLYSTCAIDAFLEILLFFYVLNIDQTKHLFDSEDPLVRKISEVVQQLLLTYDFCAAKFTWLTTICWLSPGKDMTLHLPSSVDEGDNVLITYIYKVVGAR